MAKRNDSPKTLLEASVRAARRALRECETARFVAGTHVWIFALFAKQIGSTASVRNLIEVGRPLDAELIVRSIYDALFQIVYILRSDRPRGELLELFELEMAADDFEELKFLALLQSTSVGRLARRDPIVKQRLAAYEVARQHPAFRRRRGWPKRLRYVSASAMKQVMRRQRLWSRHLDYLVTALGDSAAHSRYPALRTFLKMDSDGNPSFATKPRPTGVHEPNVTTLSTFLCLLLTTDTIVEAFGLGDPFASRVSELHKRWLAMAKGAA